MHSEHQSLLVLCDKLKWPFLCVCLKLGVVNTEGGMVEGKTIRLGLLRTMDVFRGVPFAAVPGRFEKPKPHPGWDGT